MKPVTIVTSLMLLAGTAAAGPVEVGVVTGGHGFADDVELGVEDWMPEPGPESSALLGVRVGVGCGRDDGVFLGATSSTSCRSSIRTPPRRTPPARCGVASSALTT